MNFFLCVYDEERPVRSFLRIKSNSLHIVIIIYLLLYYLSSGLVSYEAPYFTTYTTQRVILKL